MSGTAVADTATTTKASLCLSITRSAGNVSSGQPAGFTVHVWINDWTPTGKVTVELFTVKTGQQATFTTTNCHKTNSCTIPTPGKSPATLNAQVTTRHATSVTIKAVGEASAAKLSQPLTVSDSIQLMTPGSVPTPTAAPAPSLGPIAPGPLPTFNAGNINVSKLMSPGNAAGLFPSIVPSGSGSAQAGNSPTADPTRTGEAVEVLPLGMSMMTAQVIGFAALVLAIGLAALAKLLPGRRSK